MSTKKGGDKRTRAQKYKNETAFKNNKYDSNSKAKLLNQLKFVNVCQKCRDVIEWKVKYNKYKPLTAPKKCVRCSEKKVKYAYHVACTDCVVEEKVCAKCLKDTEAVELPEPDESQRQRDEARLREELKSMPLRQQKTFWRQIEKDRLSDDKGPPSADHASSSRVLECNENSDTEGDSNTEDDNDCELFDNEARHT